MPIPPVPLPPDDELPHRHARGCLAGVLGALALTLVLGLCTYWYMAAAVGVPR